MYAGSHWSRRNTLAHRWHDEIAIFCKKNKVKKINQYPVEIRTTSFFKSKRIRDTDNCILANKLICDGLVLCGILKDDTPQYVARHVVECPQFGCKKDYTTVHILLFK